MQILKTIIEETLFSGDIIVGNSLITIDNINTTLTYYKSFFQSNHYKVIITELQGEKRVFIIEPKEKESLLNYTNKSCLKNPIINLDSEFYGDMQKITLECNLIGKFYVNCKDIFDKNLIKKFIDDSINFLKEGKINEK